MSTTNAPMVPARKVVVELELSEDEVKSLRYIQKTYFPSNNDPSIEFAAMTLLTALTMPDVIGQRVVQLASYARAEGLEPIHHFRRILKNNPKTKRLKVKL